MRWWYLMKSGLSVRFVFIVAFCILTVFCVSFLAVNPLYSSDCCGKPAAPIEVSVVAHGISQNDYTEPFILTATVVASKPFKKASLLIKPDIDKGLIFHSGDTTWEGPLKANVPVEISALVSLPSSSSIGLGIDTSITGDENLGAKSDVIPDLSKGVTVSATGGLYFDNGTKLFKTAQKTFVTEGSTMKVADSQLSAIKAVSRPGLTGIIEVEGVEQ